MWKEKLGGYCLDISKYILTGVVIATMFKDIGESKLSIYLLGFFASIIILIAGMLLFVDAEKDKSKKSKKK